jgi:hypothetical protein
VAAERSARERAEGLLEGMRRGHRMLEGLVGETRAIVGRLAATFAAAPPDTAAPGAPGPFGELQPRRSMTGGEAAGRQLPGVLGEVRSAEMADALAAAVERLRARAEEPAPDGMSQTTATAPHPGTATIAPEAPAAGSMPEARAPRPAAEVRAARITAEKPAARAEPEMAAARAPGAPAGVERRSAPRPSGRPVAPEMPARPVLKLPEHKHSLSLIGRWRLRRKQRRGR